MSQADQPERGRVVVLGGRGLQDAHQDGRAQEGAQNLSARPRAEPPLPSVIRPSPLGASHPVVGARRPRPGLIRAFMLPTPSAWPALRKIRSSWVTNRIEAHGRKAGCRCSSRARDSQRPLPRPLPVPRVHLFQRRTSPRGGLHFSRWIRDALGEGGGQHRDVAPRSLGLSWGNLLARRMLQARAGVRVNPA
jgi:hypothetical protein